MPPPPAALTGSSWELCAAPLLGYAVGFGAGARGRCAAGGRGPRKPLPRDFHRRPQQVNLLPVDILHVVLGRAEGQVGDEAASPCGQPPLA